MDYKQKGNELGDALVRKNGLDASRLMQSVGSCHWSEVFESAKRNAPFGITMSSEGNDGTGYESISIYLSYDNFNPMAKARDKACKEETSAK